jgi:hypothetical protein
MYWFLTWAWAIGGTIAFWKSFSAKWNDLDHFERIMIEQIRVLHAIPGAEGYTDLKFSVLRHAVAFFISALFMEWTRSFFITSTITFLNLIYCYFSITRYRQRKNEVNDTADSGSTELASFMEIPVSASFYCVIHAVASTVLLYVLLVFR